MPAGPATEASSNSSDSSRSLAGRHSPILVATILVTLGWTVLVVRTDSFDFSGTTEVAAQVAIADDAAQRAEEVASDPQAEVAQPFFQLLVPNPNATVADWVDQAVLIVLLDEGEDDDLDTRVLRLRRIGIRSARDLARAADAPADGIRGQAAEILGRGNVIDHWHRSDLGPTGTCLEIVVEAGSDHFALAAS